MSGNRRTKGDWLPKPRAGGYALVTGSSSGIGTEIARGLARRGHNVILAARRLDRLNELAGELSSAHGIEAVALEVDLGDAAARDRLVEEISERGAEIDVLVNNAGYGSGGSFVELDHDSELAMIRVNCEAVIDLCHRYGDQMVAAGRGAILNVASTVSFQPVPRQATYSASKALVRTFTEALHEELRASGVAATTLCPGPVRTEFIEVAAMEDVAGEAPGFIWTTPEFVAEAGITGLEQNRRVVVPGLANRAGSVAGTHAPHGLLLRAMGRFYPVGR